LREAQFYEREKIKILFKVAIILHELINTIKEYFKIKAMSYL